MITMLPGREVIDMSELKLLPEYFNISLEKELEIEIFCIKLAFRDRVDEGDAIEQLKKFTESFSEEERAYAFYTLGRNMVLAQTLNPNVLYFCQRAADRISTVASLSDEAIRQFLIQDRERSKEFLRKQNQLMNNQSKPDYIR